MYKAIIRPLLFLLDPEKVHHLVVFMVKMLNCIPGLNYLLRNYLFGSVRTPGVEVAGLKFKSRIGLAAGFDKNASFLDAFSMFGFSFIEIGTVTPKPQPGNPKPRLFRLPADRALVNRMGFNSKGVDVAVRNLQQCKRNVLIGGNIGKNTATPNELAARDYAETFEKLYGYVDYFAVNVSCPNISGLEKLQDKDSLREILNSLMKIRHSKGLYKPVFLKISPDLSNPHIDEILEIYREVGLDGIIAANTTTGRNGLATAAEKVNQIGNGGLSGKPLTNRTLEVIRYICKQPGKQIPVIGVGGIMSASDAVEMIRAGAVLIQLYTGFIYEGPFLVRNINKAMANLS
jgi:dihydroorotate dehydrogenase